MAGFGNYSFLETTDIFNLAINSTMALRASVHMEWRDSLYDSIHSNPLPGGQGAGGLYQGSDNRKLQSGRIGFLWHPNDDFEAVLKVDLDKLYFGSHISSGVDPATGTAQDIRNPIVNGPHYYEDHGSRTSLDLHYTLPNGTTLNSLTGYSSVYTHADWDINGADPAPFALASHGTFSSTSEEINLVSPKEGHINWVAGVFLQRYSNDIPSDGFGFVTNNSNSPSYVTPWDKLEHTYAAFGQVGFVFVPELELQVGGRYGRYEFDQFTHFVADFSALGGGPFTTFTDLEPGGHTEHYQENSTDWKVNLNYQPNSDHFVYAAIARGHSPGSINLASPSFFADPNHGSYTQMKVTNYEIGWKTQWLDHRLRWNGAVFWEDWKNFQFSFLGPNSVTIIENGGNARIKGIENEIEWAATNNLTLSTNFTFLDPRLTENYCGTAGVTSCATQVNSETFGPPLIGPLAPAGTNLPITPKFKGNIIARYNFNEVAGWKPFAQASWVYQSKSTPTLKVDQAKTLGTQAAYGLVDLMGGAQLNQMTIQLIVTNVADRRAQLSRFVQTNPDNDNQAYIIPTQPRTVAIQFGQKF